MLCEHCACVLDDVLYVAGGQTHYTQDGRYTTNVVHRFNSKVGTWIQVMSD